MKRDNYIRLLAAILCISLSYGASSCADNTFTSQTGKNVEPFHPSFDGVQDPSFGNPGAAENPTIAIQSATATYTGTQTLPTGVNATNFWQGSESIANTFDGNFAGGIYHSPYAAPNFYPVELVYQLDPAATALEGVSLYPRNGGGNGTLSAVDVYVMCEGETEWTLLGSRDDTGGVMTMVSATAFENPRQVRVVARQGAGGFVSLAEIVCFTLNHDNDSYFDYFTDRLCSEVKPEYTLEDLDAIDNVFFRNLAKSLWYYQNGQTPGADEDPEVIAYNPEGRLRKVETYPSPDVFAKSNGTRPYGLLDNALGVYASWDEDIVIFVDQAAADMTLRLMDPMKQFLPFQEEKLLPGMNVFKSKGKGLMYLVYQSNVKSETTIHIASGTYNGVYDVSKNTPDEWPQILDGASFTHLDVLGEYTELIMPISEFRAAAPTPDGITKLVDAFDLIAYQEQVFSGLEKYDRMNPTRLCVIGIDAEALMFAGNYYTGYSLRTLGEIMVPELLLTTAIWGPAHELGHANQTSPGITWGRGAQGEMVEVSNNIYSMYMQTSLGNHSRLLEQDDYNTAYQRFFVDKAAHDVGKGYDNCFNRLIPFWQLYLYFSRAGKYTVAEDPEDFYKDLFETLRNDTEYANHNDGATNVRWCMDRFVMHTSNVAETNMVDFFNAYGFNVSAATVAQIEANGYPKPAMEIKYINDDNIDLYRNSSTMEAGSAYVVWSSPAYYTVSIQDDSKNAVAYEVYASSTSTTPIYINHNRNFEFVSTAPPSSVKIKAVGVDGTRVDVNLAY